MCVAGRVSKKRRETGPEELRCRIRLPLQLLHRDRQLAKRLACGLVRARRLTGAPEVVRREIIGQCRVMIRITHQTRQQRRLGEERTRRRILATQCELPATARVGDGAVVLQPIGRQSQGIGNVEQLPACRVERSDRRLRCLVDLDDRRIRRDRRPGQPMIDRWGNLSTPGSCSAGGLP